MHRKNLQITVLSALVMSSSIVFSGFSYAAIPENANVVVHVEAKQELLRGIVNWQKGVETDIVATGIGLPPENMPAARGRALARRAAIVDAQRNLLETIKGVQLDAETTMEDLVVTSDVVRTQVNGLVSGFVILDECEMDDGSYQVTLSIPMYGKQNSLAAIAVPELTKNIQHEDFEIVEDTDLSQAEVENLKNMNVSGVIVDASGLGLERTFSPVIYDTNGRAVYGIKNIDYDFAISQGMVTYANSVANAQFDSRAGKTPLVVQAQSVRGGGNSVNMVNVVVSVEDADRILLANQASGMLVNCSVVFVK